MDHAVIRMVCVRLSRLVTVLPSDHTVVKVFTNR